MKKIYFLLAFWAILPSIKAQNVATFENIQLAPDSWWYGLDGSGGFSSGGFYFPIEFNSEWASWSGFSVSNMKDSVSAGWDNQYSAITAGGVDSSINYSTVYISNELIMELPDPAELRGFYVTNATYTYYAMKNGDSFSKKFGGTDGNDTDFLKLIISGTDIFGNESNVEFFLADFTSENSTEDYILKDWRWVDLSLLGVVTELKFTLESSDVGDWGMNTPAYFCIDNFNAASPEISAPLLEAGMEDLEIPAENYYNGEDGAGGYTSGEFYFENDYNAEWDSWSGFAASTITDNRTAGWTNQYSVISGSGALQSNTYAIAHVNGYSEISFNESTVSGFFINNATYAFYSIRDGDSFCKSFGGADGNDPDWFKLTIAGISEMGDTVSMMDYYLADFRFENNNDDYIIDDWQWIDISHMGKISKLRFSLSSSDNGAWGMNTPSYFCIDQLNHQDIAPVVQNPIETIEEASYPDHVYYVLLDSVFADYDNPDSQMAIKIESIDNKDLLAGSIVVGGKPGEDKILLALNISPNTTGLANITVSATSNGKKVYHTFTMIVTVPVSIEQLTVSDINVYPNPVNSVFFVDCPSVIEQLTLSNSSGQIIVQQNNISGNKIRINELQAAISGLYFLKLKTKNSTISKKIIKL